MPKKSEEELRSKAARYVLAKTTESTFFNEDAESKVPRFKPCEIRTDTFLGEGGFCTVKEIAKITLAAKKEAKSNGGILYDDYGKIIQDRSFIATHALRDDCARYAIKKLSPKLKLRSNGTFVSGVIDLAMEVKYLSVIQHRNIIKMRAISSCHPCSDDFFIVLDRLYETLTDRLIVWQKMMKKQRGLSAKFKRLSIGANADPSMDKNAFLAERLLVAHDVGSAVGFLHSKRVIYRDIKPDNIGFDIRGDVKIFDFGLAQELNEKHRVQGTDTFKLTKRCGSPRYMAPEVFKGFPYNQTIDVYSFGLLLWQIATGVTPFEDFDYQMLSDNVMYGTHRPAMNLKWSTGIQNIIASAWHSDHNKRPECNTICTVLKNEIAGLCGSDVSAEMDFTSRTEASVKGEKK